MKPSEPGLWNVQGYEKAWKEHPGIMDFLDPSAPNHREKLFQRDIYMGLIGRFLASLPEGSRILDAAGGIGRFAVPLARMGHKVCLVDACSENLEAARRHGKGLPIEYMLSGIEDMGSLDRSFDAALAIEAICYCSEPEKALHEIKRRVKPGGIIILSVENRLPYGMEGDTISRKGDVHVKLYTEDGFRKMLESAGLKVLLLEGCHYISDGPFEGRLPMTMEMERKMRKEHRDMARAWLAVCEVKP
jgi:ubiquinone/menaquinone biosynthesis C-methylase UbiE